jgi:hypothetical protein
MSNEFCPVTYSLSPARGRPQPGKFAEWSAKVCYTSPLRLDQERLHEGSLYVSRELSRPSHVPEKEAWQYTVAAERQVSYAQKEFLWTYVSYRR